MANETEHMTRQQLVEECERLRIEIQTCGALYVKTKEELEDLKSGNVVIILKERFEALSNTENLCNRMLEVNKNLQGTIVMITNSFEKATNVTIPELSKTVATLTDLLNKKN